MKTAVIGFIGGGNMAQAILRGLLAAGHPPDRIQVADPAEVQREAIAAMSADIEVMESNTGLLNTCDIVVLAVKPQIMRRVVEALANVERPKGQLMLSIAAGIKSLNIKQWLKHTSAVVRAMPNTPALIGEGMSGLYADSTVNEAERALATYVMEAAGKALWFDKEEMLDGVTAISGSGPAYFFLVMEILQDVAIELGFSAADARLLATQTAFGAGGLATQTDEDLETLRKRVTSPGGTTAAALDTLMEGGIRDIFRSALIAARDRSIELGRQKP